MIEDSVREHSPEQITDLSLKLSISLNTTEREKATAEKGSAVQKFGAIDRVSNEMQSNEAQAKGTARDKDALGES